jgi:DNA-binding transcriptional LysR family regulator
MLDVRRMRVLREVARRGSFSAAAESLAYTQSAVSQQIAALEREAGTRLVERNARGVRLTDAGRALVDHAHVVLARLAAAEAELDAIAGVRGGRVRLASFPTASAALLPPALARFTERHPDVELTFLEKEPEDAIQMLRAGELEVAIVFEFHNLSQGEWDRLYGGAELHPLVDDPMYLALPLGHRLAHKPRVRLQDLSDELWIQEGNPRNPCGRLHQAACLNAGFDPRIGFRSDDYNVVQGMVAAGVGVSLLPSFALANVRDDIVVRALGKSAPARQIAAATLAGGYRSPATEAMLDILREVAAEFELPAGAAVAAA